MRVAISFAIIATIVVCGGCVSGDDHSLSKNKEIVTRFVDISNAANWEQLEDVVAPDFKRYSAATSGEPVRSLTEFVALQKSFTSTFPDQHVHLEQMIAEGDYVAVRATYTGTQTGPMGDLPATGRSAEAIFIAVFRIESGRIAELWLEWDNLALLNQLGLFPPQAPPAE